ncbi:MAG: acylphosphatase [Acidobacteriota bacterium]|nr:MAG: acylphosphatase [Acidobacteriota bacterium]
MSRTLRGIVHGRVQGVYFRAWTREQAQLLGLAGWVRNRHDGTVEVLAQGESAALETFESKLQQGPHAARVDRVEVEYVDSELERSGFEIRY